LPPVLTARAVINAIIHADLIAGLPGEDISSFGAGFDRLWSALSGAGNSACEKHPSAEIQLGILKQLPGAPISRHNDKFAMCYSPLPPYEIMQTSAMTAEDILRLKNFARFWELIINRKLTDYKYSTIFFDKFLILSDSLFAYFGRNWGIDKKELSDIFTELVKNL